MTDSETNVGDLLLACVHLLDRGLGVDKVGRVGVTRLKVIELWVDGEHVVQSVENVVFQRLLLGTVGIVYNPLLQYSIALLFVLTLA
jgi:hypothetical protein